MTGKRGSYMWVFGVGALALGAAVAGADPDTAHAGVPASASLPTTMVPGIVLVAAAFR